LESTSNILDIYIHPFYNRIGSLQNGEYIFEENDSNLDINLFKPDGNGKYNKNTFESFLYLKNLISLHSKKTAAKYIKDTGINS
jgi:hypothetical protein